MPYISTSRPLPAVMLVNLPAPLFRYSALSDRLPARGVQSRPFTRNTSSQPSPSTSKNAAPDPIVSGSHFLPSLAAVVRELDAGGGGDVGELDAAGLALSGVEGA